MVQSPDPFGAKCHDHPPMVSSPRTSGSSPAGNRIRVQAHLPLDKTSSCKTSPRADTFPASRSGFGRANGQLVGSPAEYHSPKSARRVAPDRSMGEQAGQSGFLSAIRFNGPAWCRAGNSPQGVGSHVGQDGTDGQAGLHDRGHDLLRAHVHKRPAGRVRDSGVGRSHVKLSRLSLGIGVVSYIPLFTFSQKQGMLYDNVQKLPMVGSVPRQPW